MRLNYENFRNTIGEKEREIEKMQKEMVKIKEKEKKWN